MKISKKMTTTLAILGTVIFTVPATAYASQVLTLPWTKNIYHVSDTEDNTPTVSVFDDGDNKCYIINRNDTTYTSPMAISCIKR